jgi:hypothetical protein
VRGALAPVLKNIRMAWGRPGAPAFERIIILKTAVDGRRRVICD